MLMWPRRCGGHAGWRHGRVDVVDTRGCRRGRVDVALVDVVTPFLWVVWPGPTSPSQGEGCGCVDVGDSRGVDVAVVDVPVSMWPCRCGRGRCGRGRCGRVDVAVVDVAVSTWPSSRSPLLRWTCRCGRCRDVALSTWPCRSGRRRGGRCRPGRVDLALSRWPGRGGRCRPGRVEVAVGEVAVWTWPRRSCGCVDVAPSMWTRGVSTWWRRDVSAMASAAWWSLSRSLSRGEGQRAHGGEQQGGDDVVLSGVGGRMNQHQSLMFNSNSAPTRNDRVRS